MLAQRELTIATLLRVFRGRITLTWAITLCETGLMALMPLSIGFAIDGLMADKLAAFWQLSGLMAALIVVSVLRRLYDTRVYGTIRVELGNALVRRCRALPVSAQNARLGMGRELVDFLEHLLPEAMAAAVQWVIAIIVLYAFSPRLALACSAVTIVMMAIYALFHRRFYRLNNGLNQQMERQVSVIEQRRSRPLHAHLLRLRRLEVGLSDAESLLYGSVFIFLLALILFNLWYATTQLEASVGTIFSIISYSWEFVDSALALPATLQSWTRLSEIMRRLNGPQRKEKPAVA